MNHDKELNKLAILLRAMDATKQHQRPDFEAELRHAAWCVLHDNPGITFVDWLFKLLREYPGEVADAIGVSEPKAVAALTDWWISCDYCDDASGLCKTFAQWADYFATEKSVELYDLLCEAKRHTNQAKK